jgi:hypothetical protein
MNEQELNQAVRRIYFSAFRHGFMAAMCGSIIYYFFI